MGYPVNQPYVITTYFGVPDSNAYFGRHSGIDYAVPLNRTVYAPKSGKITYAQKHPTGGNMLIIFDGTRYHRLMHNNSFIVTSGTVIEGQPVAKAGTTGLSTGVHVHWDCPINQVPKAFSDFIDPLEYIEEGEEMLTKDQLVDLWVAFKGRGPTETERTRYIGKTTYAKLREDLLNSAAFAGLVKAASEGKLNATNHLTTPLKRAYVAPGTQVLSPGKYEVK